MKKQFLLLCVLIAGNAHIQGAARPGEVAEVKNPCPICYEELNDGNYVTQSSNCVHKYHTKCIYGLVEFGHKNCPFCRAELKIDFMKLGGDILATQTEEASKRHMTENLFLVAQNNPSNAAVIAQILEQGAQLTNRDSQSVLLYFIAGIVFSNASAVDLAPSLILLMKSGANAFMKDIPQVNEHGNIECVSFYQALAELYKQAEKQEDSVIKRKKYAELMGITAVWTLKEKSSAEAIKQISETVLNEHSILEGPEKKDFMRIVSPFLKVAIGHADVAHLINQINKKMKFQVDVEPENVIRKKVVHLIGKFDRDLMKRRIKLAAFLDGVDSPDKELEKYVRYIEHLFSFSGSISSGLL